MACQDVVIQMQTSLSGLRACVLLSSMAFHLLEVVSTVKSEVNWLVC